ncbi:MAG: PA14 domain-containing protein [Pseudobacter sp.]|uniref:PA14 domain-containing protein n=1 Tax=Pseudobacter sp. TaxID=2045420 RepID=UPI003F7D308C
MVQTLSRYQKTIAWLLYISIYLQLILTPFLATAESGRYRPLYAFEGRGIATNRPLKKIHREVIAPVSNKIPVSAAAKQPAVKSDLTDLTDHTLSGGPTQPEMSAFSSVGNSNMVDLFSGDFSYTIPLLDVGGYPLALGYNAGITMDQEASWVGLGWNINPGTITRNLRGLPDDFKGDTVKKTVFVKENKTIGVNVAYDKEVAGVPIDKKLMSKKDAEDVKKSGLNFGLGVTHNNYKGWGLEVSHSIGLNAGKNALGPLSGGLSLSSSSMSGLSVTPSAGFVQQLKEKENSFSFTSISLPYNSRSGLGSLQLSTGISQSRHVENKNRNTRYNRGFSGGDWGSTLLSFYTPSVMPSINVPFTSRQFTFSAKIGWEEKILHRNIAVSGYVSRQYVAPADTTTYLPSYGYLNYQHAAPNGSSLLDYNREKELPFREKPAYPHIAVPSYSYDAFSISGEGTGGMFRAYRSEIGFVYDNRMRSGSSSERFSLDVGAGPDIAHLGFEVGPSSSSTRTGPWLADNRMADSVRFRNNDGLFQAAYFRNPGEKAINDKAYYAAVGDDDLVTLELEQRNSRDPNIVAASNLIRYRQGEALPGTIPVKKDSTLKRNRDKRVQVISYLNAREADAVGLNKYIDNYTYNVFDPSICGAPDNDPEDFGTGLTMELFGNKLLTGSPALVWYGRDELWQELTNGYPKDQQAGVVHDERWSIRWTGRMRAPVTGSYSFRAKSDDGFYLNVNGKNVIDNWKVTNFDAGYVYGSLNLEAGQFYEVEAAMFDNKKYGGLNLEWQYPGAVYHKIPRELLYPKATDSLRVRNPADTAKNLIVKEKRINDFRKAHHMSEISVLNNDGKRYIYGIPVYNLKLKDVTFSTKEGLGNMQKGMVKFTPSGNNPDNTTKNRNGKDNYFSKEEIPAYAHSFLLTGILSDDYSDLTGNGITEDDPGSAVKFNYSKICGYYNPFRWRTPAGPDSAAYNEGLRTDYRDDKGTYVYGEKELWYLHSIESKTMIATFVLSSRKDMPSVKENGERIYDSSAKRLEKIHLYSKADFNKYGKKAKPVKTVHFDYSYELCRGALGNDTGKLTLKKIWFTYNGVKRDSAQSNPYRFRYHSNNPRYNNQASDRWGSYKHPSQNPNSIAGDTVRNAEYAYALQDSALAAQNAGAWNLESIDLPSGGMLKIDYESDDYGYVQNRQAMQMYQIAGFNSSPNYNTAVPFLYGIQDYRYVFIKVPSGGTAKDIYDKYLSGIEKIYFKVFVRVPKDNYNNGQTHEYIPGYARLEKGAGSYGVAAGNIIWVKLQGLHLDGNAGGEYSPMMIAATQFLKQNLPSKAWPGSETGDDLDMREAISVVSSLVMNVVEAVNKFETVARQNGLMAQVDIRKSFVRLLSPQRKKYGGGHRVKRVTLFDNWNKMTGQRDAKYGQEYSYTTDENSNGSVVTYSSGVASYEPAIGAEENPFHMPIEYIDQPSVLLPSSRGYTEEPLGESFFPSPGIGYSRVRVRTINHLKKKSANGFDETSFYTAKDFPVFTERTVFDPGTFKRYRPALSNFLRIMAYHYLTLSQGFKVELNDMHGKLRSKASYPENDHKNYTSYAEYFYRSENTAGGKRLKNTVMAIRPDGVIDTAAVIGKDVELMMDLREQESISESINLEPNSEMFSAGTIPAILLIALNFYQREINRYRSAATVKVINRYGILDSVVAVEKGSRVSTADMLYDSETGDVLMTRTQNEFEDYVYNFTYPSHWAYKGLGPAYRNIDAYVENVTIRDGRIVSGADSALKIFTGGDEIMIAGKQRTGGATCAEQIASFPNYNRIWCIDSSDLKGGTRALYFIDRKGKPYSGFDISMKVVRSGSRNIFSAVGTATSLDSMIRRDPATGAYKLQIDDNSRVLGVSAAEFRQFWKVQDLFAQKESLNCLPRWIPTGRFACVTVNGRNTGERRAEMADSNRNSSSYGSANWVSLGINCKECPVPWVKTFLRCQTVADTQGEGGSSGVGTNASGGGNPPVPITGRPIYRYTDTARCSATYGNFKDSVEAVDCVTCYGGTLCGAPPACENCDESTGLRKCINGICETARLVCAASYPAPGGYMNIYVYRFSDNSTPADIPAQNIFSPYPCSPGSYSLRAEDDMLSANAPATATSSLSSPCDPVTGKICESIVADTSFNPYLTGVLGNWRAYRALTLYTDRRESDPSISTNIRQNGAIRNFSPYWTFQQGQLKPSTDTVKWVWNSEATIFNKKGLELENRDPLGRFNSGIYGYDFTLPVSVTQNSKYRESAFDGFEDYGMNLTNCGEACPSVRHFDFGSYQSQMDTAEAHSGNRSLKILPGAQAGMTAYLGSESKDTITSKLSFLPLTGACGGTMLKEIRAGKDLLLPAFSPTAGKQMVLSVWVKESQDCKCTNYQNSRVVVLAKNAANVVTSFYFTPSGSIIEGWQRIDSVFTIPADAVSVTISMQATGSYTTWFDDLRIHPVNANMKSFVYHPVNLRLMAELDENNHASFYEYDDEGTLIRVKKETVRGIKTIKETRSAMAQQ